MSMSADGFVYVEDLLAHQQFRSFSVEDVQRVVANNDKQRFKLQTHPDDGRLQIRANQGHSVQVSLVQTSVCRAYYSCIKLTSRLHIFQVSDLELKQVAPDDPDCPKEAVHGTYMKHWPSIRSQGLSRMNRTHVHLAPGLPGEGGVISGEIIKHRDKGIFILCGSYYLLYYFVYTKFHFLLLFMAMNVCIYMSY